MSRPPFAVAWNASLQIYSSSDSKGRVAEVIGGTVAKNINMEPPYGWKNTCAVRMSYILNKSGVAIPALKGQTVTGADGKNYFFRVKDVITYLTQRWGKPDLIMQYPPSGGGAVSNQKGVILFEIAGWQDAAGHATLWSGTGCYDHCYFNEPGATYKTNNAHFWRLE